MAYRALLIGIPTYNLQYTKNDITQLANALSIYGYEIYPKSEFSSDITRGNIIDTLSTFILDCKQTDSLILYFSGHCVIKEGDLHFFINNLPSQNTISINDFIKELGSVTASNKLVIIDCCSSLQATSDWEITPSERYWILTAGDRLAKAKEIDKFKSSFLTYKLCEFLNAPPLNEVTMEDLYRWLKTESENYNRENDPKVPVPNLLGNQKKGFIFSNITDKLSKSQLAHIVANIYLSSPIVTAPSISSLSLKPKNLLDIFVDPVLSSQTENEEIYTDKQKNNTNNLPLSEILTSSKNILFVGKKESGKTSLLRYIENYYLEKPTLIPIYIDFNFLPITKYKGTILEKTINNLNTSVSEIKKHLEEGNCLIIIDNLRFNTVGGNLYVSNNFIEDIKKYKKNRFVFATSDSIMVESQFKGKPFLEVEYDFVYIHSFKREQIKKLINKWFQGEPENLFDQDNITKSIIEALNRLRLPSNPSIISWLLIAIEQRPLENYKLINKASLIEKILEFCLQKMDYSNIGLGQFDFRLTESLLSYIAYYMEVKGNYYLDKNELINTVIPRFFSDISRDTPLDMHSFVNEFLVRPGVLVDIDNNISFRFGCFAEYFIAQYMIDNEEYYQSVIKDGNFLNYRYEIDYLTGKKRNNRSLIEQISEHLEFLTSQLIDNNGLPKPIIDTEEEKEIDLNNEEILNNLSSTSNSNNIRDVLRKSRQTIADIELEPLHPSESEMKHVHRLNISKNDTEKAFIICMIMLASTLRNCELIKDSQFKKKFLRKCIDAYWIFCRYSTQGFDDYIEKLNKEDWKNEVPNEPVLSTLKAMIDEPYNGFSYHNFDEFKSQLRPAIKEFVLLTTITLAIDTLGSNSLGKILREEIEQGNIASDDFYVYFFYVLIYADLEAEGFVEKLQKVATNENTKKQPFKGVLLQRLLHSYFLPSLSGHQLQKLENLIADLKIFNDRNLRTLHKGRFIESIRRKRIIIRRKNDFD